MEIRNYLIVRDCPPERVAQALLKELVEHRQWQQVPADTADAHVIEIWPAAGGLTVADLTTWEAADSLLGKAVSTDCSTSVAAYYYFSPAEEANELVVFSCGREVPTDKSPFAALPEGGAWHLSPTSGTAPSTLPITLPVTLTIRAAPSTQGAQAMALIKRHFEPLLLPLRFVPGKIAADYPTHEYAVGYVRRLEDGRAVWVRFSFVKDAELELRQDIWLETGPSDYEPIYRGQKTRWLPHADPSLKPVLLERECRLLASQLVLEGAPRIAAQIPSLMSELGAVGSSAAWQQAAAAREQLERTRNVARERGPAWVHGTVTFRGAQLLRVQADGTRFTFKLDTSKLPNTQDAAVGEIWEGWTGSLAARKLRLGDKVVTFDYDGTVLDG